jgi:hypothetical protein
MFVPIKAVAKHFSRHPDTIRAWVKSGKFPKPTLLPSGRPAWPDTVLQHGLNSDTADALAGIDFADTA